jgi:hypothetical protein
MDFFLTADMGGGGVTFVPLFIVESMLLYFYNAYS